MPRLESDRMSFPTTHEAERNETQGETRESTDSHNLETNHSVTLYFRGSALICCAAIIVTSQDIRPNKDDFHARADT